MRNNIKDFFSRIANNNSIDLYSGIGNINTLYCGDIMDNSIKGQLYDFAKAGEHHVILNNSEKAMIYFCDHICNVIVNGKDFKYSPIMKFESDNYSVLYCAHDIENISQVHKHENISFLSLEENTPFDKLQNIIQNHLRQHKDAIIIIPEISHFINSDFSCETIIENLNKIACDNNVIFISGIKIPNENIDLAQLYDISEKKQRLISILEYHNNDLGKYCSFSYGHPKSNTIAFMIGEKEIIPSQIMPDLRWLQLFKKYALSPISIESLTNILYGVLKGEFKKISIKSRIQKACAENANILSKDGQNVVYVDPDKRFKTPIDKMAISAFTNRKKERARKRVPFVYFGNTKFIFGEYARMIAGSILISIITSKNLDFKCETTHRNILIFSIGETTNAIINYIREIAHNSNFYGDINYISLHAGINDIDFLHTFSKEINIKKPDFVFTFDMENINYNKNSETHLFDSIKVITFDHDIINISSIENDKNIPDWQKADNECICNNEYLYGEIYDFTAITNNKHIFMSTLISNGNISIANYEIKAIAYYRLLFCGICDTFVKASTLIGYHDIMLNKSITQYNIRKAIKYGVLEAKGKGKEQEIKYSKKA